MDGQCTEWLRNIAENFNHLSRVHERFRQTTDRQTDGRRHSERERELTFANKTTSERVVVREETAASATTLKISSYLLGWYFLASLVAMTTAAATRL